MFSAAVEGRVIYSVWHGGDNTLKKEGPAFRNIGKYIPLLWNQPCSFSFIECVCYSLPEN